MSRHLVGIAGTPESRQQQWPATTLNGDETPSISGSPARSGAEH